ncbi:hypothetical protein BJ741DRAFT_621193 [Chytriomyces cf. hyalinus JEL632]|nr:hypothetical protein BJ741DRAFT_621193 [Chytriomyces cf. hyalinus JEL632]
MTDTVKGKGKCWCCWEREEGADDRLIRACGGCKDPDLQWIHEKCMAAYLDALPASGRNSSTQLRCTRCCDAYNVIETWSMFRTFQKATLSQQLIIPVLVVLAALAWQSLGPFLLGGSFWQRNPRLLQATVVLPVFQVRVSLAFIGRVLAVYCVVVVVCGMRALRDSTNAGRDRRVISRLSPEDD